MCECRVGLFKSRKCSGLTGCLFLTAVAGQQAHGVWTDHERDGGGAEDLQRQGQPKDRQTVRGHQHYQHYHQVEHTHTHTLSECPEPHFV